MFLKRINIKPLLLAYIMLLVKTHYGQQNFINVPSAEITPEHKIFFQQQFNINELFQSNTTVDYGCGKGFEFGLNILGLNFNQKTCSFFNNDTNDVDPYNPLLALNGLKIFALSKNCQLGIGGQAGVNFRVHRPTYPAYLTYANFKASDILVNNSTLVAGVYYNSRHYGGRGNRAGFWAGAEVPVSSKVHLMAESILGDNSLCYTSVGLIYYIKPRFPVTFGVQIPNTAKNSYSLVLELTFNP